MTLLHPTAAVTDLMLALTAFAMAWGCWSHHLRTASRRTRWWSLGFAALGLGALTGAITLAFATTIDLPLMLLSRFSVGLAVFTMINAVVESLVGSQSAKTWRLLFLAALGVYVVATLLTNSFLAVLLYSGTTLVATLVLEVYRFLVRRAPGAALMALGMATSIIAAVLQATPLTFTLIWQFDHNGIYHLTQLVALLFLYQGATATEPASPPLALRRSML